ncbi:unnamed protein product [Caretta caretta]
MLCLGMRKRSGARRRRRLPRSGPHGTRSGGRVESAACPSPDLSFNNKSCRNEGERVRTVKKNRTHKGHLCFKSAW